MRTIQYENELKQRDETIKWQAELIAQQAEQIKRLEAEIEQLKRLLTGKAESKAAKEPRFTENYSLDKNKRNNKRRKKSTGRRSNDTKRAMIEDQNDIYWPDADLDECICHREQFAWRMVNGKAVYVCYHIYDLPDSKQLPLPPGLRNSRSEFGIEIILTLAFLHYWIGVSIDNAREIMQFFTGLELSKSQADSLLSQLAADWNEQYDTIAELIALSIIVYIDETGWKVGKRSCYTWAFSTAMHVLFRCGVGRGKAEAKKVLGEFFAGIGVTLYAIYQQAVRYQKDRRLSVSRAQKSLELQERIRLLCTRHGETIDEDVIADHEATFIRLQNELVDNLDCLFVFVEHPEVEPTNNRSERTVRCEAEIRKGGRTSKTPNGAKRRGVIMTVLASLRTRFAKFTLDNLLSEVQRWLTEGRSIFESELVELQRANAPPSLEPALLPSD